MQGLNAVSLTQGLTPQVLKNYLGTQSAQELTDFFNRTLAPYTFWKTDREKYLFALHYLVEQLNGTYNDSIGKFVLDGLQDGISPQEMTKMLRVVRQKKDSERELQALLTNYKQARSVEKTL